MQKLFHFAGCLFFILLITAAASQAQQPPTNPVTDNGRKWRIAYIEGGNYKDYQLILTELIKSLMGMGWIDRQPLPAPKNPKETLTLWRWLSQKAQSRYLSFPEDAFWSAGWNRKQHKANAASLIRRLNTQKDIDLVLAFGTLAGRALANNLHSVPTLICSVSDAVKSGIIPSENDTGYDHIHVRIDPERYERQVRLFHSVIGFRKLGISYMDTSEGRSYAAVDTIRKLSEALHFKIIECPIPYRTQAEIDNADDALAHCHETLAPRIDAYYLTLNKMVTLKALPKLLAPFFKYDIPTFAQGRTGEVGHGVLMSMAQDTFEGTGRFHAEAMAGILNGAAPGSLPIIYEDPPAVAVNMETARKIGFHFPVEVLISAEEIYERIDMDSD